MTALILARSSFEMLPAKRSMSWKEPPRGREGGTWRYCLAYCRNRSSIPILHLNPHHLFGVVFDRDVGEPVVAVLHGAVHDPEELTLQRQRHGPGDAAADT